MSTERVKHPFGRENEVAVHCLFKSFCNHVYLGQWELAVSSVSELNEQKDILRRDIGDILRQIASTAYSKSLLSEAVPSYHHLAWLAVVEQKKLNWHQVKDLSLQHEVEFRLLLFDSCSDVDEDIVKEIYLAFLNARCPQKIKSQPAPLSALTSEYLCSVLLREPTTGHDILTYLLSSESLSKEQKLQLQDLELQCLQVLLTKIRSLCEQASSGDADEPDVETLKHHFCDLFALYDPDAERKSALEKFLNDLLTFLHSRYSDNVLDKHQVLSCLLNKSSTMLLEMFLRMDVQFQELHYIDDEDANIQMTVKPVLDRTSYRDRLLVGLSRHRVRSEAWRDMFFYCYRSERHFLEIIMDTAVHLIQVEDISGLNDLLTPVEFHPLKPIVLLLGWEHCSDVQTARELLNILWTPEVECGFKGIAVACNRLSSQVKLTEWCLDKIRSLSGVDQRPASSLKSFFRGLELHSALYLLHQSTSLKMLIHDEVLDFLRGSAAATEPSKDCVSAANTPLTKQVQFILDDDRNGEPASSHQAPFMVNQEKDINTYRAFTVIKSFMDVMAFSGETSSPWNGETSRCRQELRPSHLNNNEPFVKSCAQTTAAAEIVAEVLRISEAFISEHSWLELQRHNYGMLYKQNVLDVIATAKKHISELYPVNYRLEILENIFSLLFTTQEDLLALDVSERWDSGEEGAIGDRSAEKLTVDAAVGDEQVTKDDNHNDEHMKVASGGNVLLQSETRTNRLTASDGDVALLHTRGHCSTASNHSTSSVPIKVGFLANQLILRDVLLTVSECLQDLEALTERMEGNKKEPSKSEGSCPVPTRDQHRSLVQMIPCSIAMEEVNQRCSQLMQYVSEALWRFQLVSEDWLPKEFGRLPDESLDELSSYCFKTLFKHDEQGKHEKCASKSELSELVTDGSTRTTMTDGSQSGASISSNSSHKHQRKRRRHNKSWKCQIADVMGPITRMMSDQNSLLNLCLKQGKFCQALQVVKMFNMDQTEMAKEAIFAELYSSAVKQLRLDDGPSCHRFLKSMQVSNTSRITQHPVSKSSLTGIANVAAAGLSSMLISNSVDHLLSLANLPGWHVESCKPHHQKSPLELLCDVYLEPSCMPAMICLDLACVSSAYWKTSQSLIEMASKRLLRRLNTDSRSAAVSDSGGGGPPALFKPTGQFGYEKIVKRLCSTMNLVNSSDDRHVGFYCRGIPEMFTAVTLPFDSADLQHYSNSRITVEKELNCVSSVTREHGIWPYRADGCSKETADVGSVLVTVKHLVSVVQKAIISGGWLECLLHSSGRFPRRNYLQALVNHIDALAETLHKLSTDKSQAVLQEPFHLLQYNPIRLLASLIFEAHVDPASLESACSLLHIDMTEVILQSTCLPVPAVDQLLQEAKEPRPSNQDGHILLNDSDSWRVRKTNITAEKFVRRLLTRLVHLMKETSKEVTKEDSFSVNVAERLISSGKHKNILHRTSLLQIIDLNTLVTTEQKICFYGNLLTLMGIHMWLYAIETGDQHQLYCGAKSGHSDNTWMMEMFLFQNQLAYRVGQLGMVSYFDLRYVIIRQGLIPPSCFNDVIQHRISTLDRGDPWVVFGCRGDPAMTFAIADGTPASPPLVVLNPALVRIQLINSTRLYITQSVKLERNKHIVSVSPLVHWYREDFHESANILMGDDITIAKLIKQTLPGDCADDALDAILDPEHDNVYKMKTFQYKMKWPLYVFSADTWQKLQEQATSVTLRRPSLPDTNMMPSSWPQEEPLLNMESPYQELFVLGNEALKYASHCSDLLYTVASVICCDGSNSVSEHMLEDYFQPNTPTEEDKNFSIINSDLEQFRKVYLCGRYPVIARQLWINSSTWLVEHNITRSQCASPPETLDQVLSELSLLDCSSRVCLLLNTNSPDYQRMVLKGMTKLLQCKQWEQLSEFVCSIQCDELKHFHSSLRLLHDYCICCVLTVAVENSAGGDAEAAAPTAWRLLLKLCDSELKCRMVLGTLHHWNDNVCLQLLKACLERESGSSRTTTLQQLVTKRLEEMQVYVKIISCAKEVLTKLNQSHSFTLCGRFKEMSDDLEDCKTEPDDKTSQILKDLCHWQGVIKVSRQSPEMVLEVLTYMKDFETAYKWANIYGVFDKFEQALRQVHITSLLDRSPADMVTIHQVLNKLRQRDVDKCFNVCSSLVAKLTDTSHILCVVDYMINQLRSDLGRLKLSELSTLLTGCKAVLCLPVCEQVYYNHLVSSPLLILEQLLINNKLEWAKLVLTVYSDALSEDDIGVYQFTIDDCDRLLERYATKAVEFPVMENSEASLPGVLHHSGSKASLLMTAQSHDPRLGRQMAVIGPRSFQRTGSVGLLQTADVSSVPATSHVTSGSVGSKHQHGSGMKVPFTMPAEPPPRDQWIPDSSAAVCMVCQVERFSMFNRRHHCRRCGRVVCGACSMKTTIISGRSARTCDQCYQQVFPTKDVSQQSDIQRLRQHLSSVSPETAAGGNIGITIGSPSPTQDITTAGEQADGQMPCSDFFYQLSLDDELNTSAREEFYYDHAPSTSLCLSLLDLHSNPQKCAQVLLSLCENISQHLKPIAPGLRNPEVDYGLVISMMKRMLMSAKVKYIKAGDSSGVSQCGVYVDRVNLLDQLLSNNCLYIPSMYQLTKSDTLRCLRDTLIQEERFSLAMDVSTKCGMDPVGVWVAWGKACIRIGDYKSARDKFAKCLKAPLDMNQTQSQSSNKILSDIIDCLQTTSTSKCLASVGSIKSLLADPAQKPFEDLSLDEPVIQECLFYLHNYGTHVAIVTFYRQHKLLSKAVHYILSQKCSSDVFLEGLFLPCLSSGMIGHLLEQLQIVDPSLDRWLPHLTASCKHLSRNKQIHTLYQLQLYMKDYLRAAMTCIQQFYLKGATNYLELKKHLATLHDAKKHMDTYLGERQWTVRPTQTGDTETVPRLMLTPVEVNKYIYTIETQIEVTRFLHQYHDNYDNVAAVIDPSLAAASSSQTAEPSTAAELPTLFGNTRTKSQVASLVLLCGNNVCDGYGLAFRIIQHFKLDSSSIYLDVGRHFAKLGRYKGIYQLLGCIRECGLCSDVEHDDVIMACVKVIQTQPAEAKQLESLIKAFRNDSRKIEAFISCGKLKSAYLLAVKLGNLDDVRRIHQVAEQSGQQAVSAICKQYLHKHEGRK